MRGRPSRRSFLKQIGVGASVLPLAATLDAAGVAAAMAPQTGGGWDEIRAQFSFRGVHGAHECGQSLSAASGRGRPAGRADARHRCRRLVWQPGEVQPTARGVAREGGGPPERHAG